MRPAAHHGDAVGHVVDHRQIVRDEQIGEAELVLQVLEQVEDLRLHRYVERRDRLVADQQVGIERQRPGDADALALAARKAVRIARLEARIESDRPHQLADQLAAAISRCRRHGSRAARAGCSTRSCAATSEENGSWNTIWMRVPHLLEAAALEREKVDRAGLGVEHGAAGIGGHAPASGASTPSSCRSRFRRPAPGIRRAGCRS